MELNIVKHIKEHGLEKTLKEFKLKSRDYGHKVVIKYDMIHSDLNLIEVQESRGLVLEKETWKVMSLGFMKFFNASEPRAAKIDWSSAHILEKMDGTFIHLYWDWILEKWCIGTTGTAEGEGEVNNKFGTTFADLFWSTSTILTEHLVKGNTFMFELCTPYNIVVKPHSDCSITLLGIRDLTTLKEDSYKSLISTADLMNIKVVKAFDLNATNVGHLEKTFNGMPFTEEGYVVVDKNFNRIKIKNPTYVTAHLLKSKTSEHAIMEIIKDKEVEEYAATFPERNDEIVLLEKAYYKLIDMLKEVSDILNNHLPKNVTAAEKKKYALKVFEVSGKYGLEDHKRLFFNLPQYRYGDVDENLTLNYVRSIDNKKLYNMLDIEDGK